MKGFKSIVLIGLVVALAGPVALFSVYLELIERLCFLPKRPGADIEFARIYLQRLSVG